MNVARALFSALSLLTLLGGCTAASDPESEETAESDSALEETLELQDVTLVINQAPVAHANEPVKVPAKVTVPDLKLGLASPSDATANVGDLKLTIGMAELLNAGLGEGDGGAVIGTDEKGARRRFEFSIEQLAEIAIVDLTPGSVPQAAELSLRIEDMHEVPVGLDLPAPSLPAVVAWSAHSKQIDPEDVLSLSMEGPLAIDGGDSEALLTLELDDLDAELPDENVIDIDYFDATGSFAGSLQLTAKKKPEQSGAIHKVKCEMYVEEVRVKPNKFWA